ncbi:MAG: phage tail sheath subtilisin-like domain-containing protein [Lachnospiraceae bacterium]|nr:phage tail sheath subtilisin-like domain-containing protein [Lachnospiraceae bacterium]
MGAPSIDISFIEKAISAITRGERGIVMLWVKDALPTTALNPVTVVTESDIPDGLSDATVEQVKLAMIGYVNAPKKVLVYCMGIAEEAEEEAVETGYKKAMTAAETIRFDYLAIPTVETDSKGEDIAAWVKFMRTNKKKKIKAVLPNVAADNEGIINFATEKSVKTETITTEDGTKATVDTTYTAEQYCARIAGLIAGTPMTIACTYAPLPELSDCTRLTDIDTPVDNGELIIFYDGEKVKVARGVNSFVTTIDGKGDSFKKIKIVEAMDMINDDIVKTVQDSYLGKYANKYPNKCLLITAINSYFAQLKRDDIVRSYSVGLDAEAIRRYLKEKGKQATLDDGTVKDVDECSDEEIITADTGASIFLTGNVKILDAIEDFKMPIYI